eukprot:scaffold123816_cov48-Prasinocladus_malaysianus.AAC.3
MTLLRVTGNGLLASDTLLLNFRQHLEKVQTRMALLQKNPPLPTEPPSDAAAPPPPPPAPAPMPTPPAASAGGGDDYDPENP